MPKRQNSAHRLKESACPQTLTNCRLRTIHWRLWKSCGEDSLLSLIRKGSVRAGNNEIHQLAACYLRKQLQCRLTGIVNREERLSRMRIGNPYSPVSPQHNCCRTLAKNGSRFLPATLEPPLTFRHSPTGECICQNPNGLFRP